MYSAGKLVAEYTTAAPPENPTTRYTATDMLGSPRVITDSEGNVIARRDFKPFGEEITNNTGERAPASYKYGAADNLRQKFTTYQRDEETGLDFAEARMYENRHGRFTAVDPLLASGKSANPQTFNRFVYVGNSPLIITDPIGLDWFYNKKRDIYTWSDDGKTTDNGDAINDDWEKVSKFTYWAGEETGYVALDPLSRTWATGFDSEDEALIATDPPMDWSLSDGVNEMLNIYDGVTIVGAVTTGVVRRGVRFCAREGGEYLVRRTLTELLREKAEQILIQNGEKITKLAVSRITGRLAEELAAERLVKSGYELLGSQVTVRLADGRIRYVDHLVRKGDEILAFEIKSGGATRSTIQKAKDELIEKSGGILGNNAPNELKGATIKFKTIERNIDDF